MQILRVYWFLSSLFIPVFAPTNLHMGFGFLIAFTYFACTIWATFQVSRTAPSPATLATFRKLGASYLPHDVFALLCYLLLIPSWPWAGLLAVNMLLPLHNHYRLKFSETVNSASS